jgi:branched-chain amino acid transport system ATP-binding protein
MLRVRSLNVAIGPVPIVRDASLDLSEGEMCGLIGRNGAGKTTLMRALMGAIAASGSAELDHVDLLELPAHRRLAHGIGYMPEDRRLVPDFTVEENIRLPSWSLKMDGAEQRLEWIFALMPEIPKFRDRRAMELSGGQQKMVALARALMAGRRMLLLDEPFEGLAPALARRLGEVLADLKAEGVSVLIAESNDIHVGDLLARAYRIERGSVAAV